MKDKIIRKIFGNKIGMVFWNIYFELIKRHIIEHQIAKEIKSKPFGADLNF